MFLEIDNDVFGYPSLAPHGYGSNVKKNDMVDYSIAIKSTTPGTPEAEITETKAYAALQYSGHVTTEGMAKIISAACTVQRADVFAVLNALDKEIFSQLLAGKIVNLGPIGKLYLTMVAKNGGAETAEGLIVNKNTYEVGVRLGESDETKESVLDTQWNVVPSRKAQADAVADAKRQENKNPDFEPQP